MSRFGGKREQDDQADPLDTMSTILSDISKAVDRALELTARMHEREQVREQEDGT